MNSAKPTIEERRQARADAKKRMDRIWAGHEQIQAMVGTKAGKEAYQKARRWIGVCKKHKSCSETFLSAWDAILDHPDRLLMMLEAGERDYLIQASPFLPTINELLPPPSPGWTEVKQP